MAGEPKGAVLELPYVPIDPGIEESDAMFHFLELSGLEDDPMGWLRIVALLIWVGRNRPDGNLKKISPRKIAKEMHWDGDPCELVSHLLQSGWLVENDGSMRVADWEDYGGQVLSRRKQWAKEKRRQRCAEAGHKSDKCECPENVRGRPADIQETSAGVRTCPPLKVKSEGEEVKSEKVNGEVGKPHTLAKVKVNGPDKQLVADGRAVLARYKETFPKLPQPVEGDPQHRRIVDRLKEPNINLGICLLAIEGSAGDEFYQGKGLHSIKDIFKNNDKVIELATKALHQRDGPKLPDGKLKRNLSEGDEWLIAEENAR